MWVAGIKPTSSGVQPALFTTEPPLHCQNRTPVLSGFPWHALTDGHCHGHHRLPFLALLRGHRMACHLMAYDHINLLTGTWPPRSMASVLRRVIILCNSVIFMVSALTTQTVLLSLSLISFRLIPKIICKCTFQRTSNKWTILGAQKPELSFLSWMLAAGLSWVAFHVVPHVCRHPVSF